MTSLQAAADRTVVKIVIVVRAGAEWSEISPICESIAQAVCTELETPEFQIVWEERE